jgi:hypothetical protein
MELTLASLVNEMLSGLPPGPAAAAEVAASRTDAAAAIAGQRARQRTLHHPVLNGLRRAAGTQLASSHSKRGAVKRGRHEKMLKQLIADESGATAVEQGLIATGIALRSSPR